MKQHSIKTVVATGIGAALFVVIGLVVNIPTFVPNTNIQLQYAVQSLFSVIFGPVVGFLIGFIGHTVKDSVSYSPWWSWILASGLLGFLIGLLKKRLRVEEGIFTSKDILLFNGTQIITNVISWGLVAPLLDIIIYQEPANKSFTQGLIAGIANAVTIGVAGTLLVKFYANSRTQAGSLSIDK